MLSQHVTSRVAAAALLVASFRARALGDVEGHEFHGNQWTSGGGGTEYPTGLTKIGAAKGSNPGGLHVDTSGQKWYVKQYGNPEQAASEHVATQIYKAVGAKVPETALGPHGELASKWLPDAGKTLGQTGLTKENSKEVLNHFAADVFTANWDAVGTGHDNVLVGKNGETTRVDQGGTLLYRAQGGLKPEAGLGKIGEWNTLADKGMNTYYNAVFKKAGVENGDHIPGVRAQIEKIVAARPADGWKGFVERAAPAAPKSFHKKVGAMLELRQKGLESKTSELKLRGLSDRSLAEWAEEDHPRGPDGKFEGTGTSGSGEKAKKAKAAAPVPIELKHKAYEMVKAGSSFKATAAALGMTQGQVAGHVWKVDQKKKAIEASVKSVVIPVAPKASGPLWKSSLDASHGVTFNNTTNKWDVKNEKTGEVVSSWGTHDAAASQAQYESTTSKYGSQTAAPSSPKYNNPTPVAPGPPSGGAKTTTSSVGEKIKTDPSTGHIVVSKDGKEASYQWTEKTKANSPYAKDNLGKYAYFKDGIQVSGAFPKSEHAEAAGSINQGKGPSVGAVASTTAAYKKVDDEFVAHVTQGAVPASDGSWPILNSVDRKAGANYTGEMAKIGNAWSPKLTKGEVSALKGYTGSSYHGVNVALRQGASINASISAKAIASAISKAPAPPPPELVWRGVAKASALDLVKGLSNGDVMRLDGFQSTSIDPQFAKNWSGGHALFEIKPKAGAYVDTISSNKGEREYLMPHGAKYAVRGIAHVHINGQPTHVVQLEML